MLGKIKAIRKALSQGWVPEYDGVAVRSLDNGKSEGVKILSDSNHRCVVYYVFKDITEYYDYINSKNRMFYGWNGERLGKFSKSIINFYKI